MGLMAVLSLVWQIYSAKQNGNAELSGHKSIIYLSNTIVPAGTQFLDSQNWTSFFCAIDL